MNHYYVDTRNSNAGDGSKNNPYKKLSSFFKSAVSQPFTLHLLGGQYELINETIYPWSQFINNSSEQSFITVDKVGDSEYFDLINTSNTVHLGGKLNQTTIRNIQFKHVGAVCDSSKVDITPEAQATNKIANVWLEDCNFISAPWTKQTNKVFAVSIKGWDSALNEAHKFGARRCNVYNCTAGINAMGNAEPTSSTSNIGDNKRGKGIVIEYCGFVDVPGDCAILNGATSELDPYTQGVNDLTSRITGCYATQQNNPTLQYTFTASMWFYSSNKCLIDNCQVINSIGSLNDKQAFDFDEMCWDNLIRNCYTVGNCGGFVLTSSWGGREKPSGYAGTDYDWYYTQRFGGGNNKVINCISYNDGTIRGIVQLQGFVYNMTFKNNTVIRTQRSGNYDLFGGGSFVKGAFDNSGTMLKTINLDNNLFLTHGMTVGLGLNWAGGEGRGQAVSRVVSLQNTAFDAIVSAGSFGEAQLTNNKYDLAMDVFSGSGPAKKSFITKYTSSLGYGAV